MPVASYHDTKTALRGALASLVTANPSGPIRSVHEGSPGLYSGDYPALCVFATGSERSGEAADESFGPNVFLFGVAGIALKVPTGPREDVNARAEEEASLALSAWLDALETLVHNGIGGAVAGRPVLSVDVVSTRSGDADQYGNEFFDAGGQSLFIDGCECRITLL